MNKLIFLTSLIALCLFAACDDEEPTPTCIELAQNANWTSENFKSDYTIQFPADYEGQGMIGFEGNTFFKNRMDDLVDFSYFYCDSGLFCEDFGDTLAVPPPESIIVSLIDATLLLPEAVEFCDTNGDLSAILYHDSAATSTGRLYMKQSNDFLEALHISYAQETQQEVEDIIKTINEI